MSLTDDLTFALHLADVADAITMRSFREPITFSQKEDGSAVTDADVAVEIAIGQAIETYRPSDYILGEETGTKFPLVDENFDAKRTWILDPIDQTMHYMRGNSEFATLIALSEGSRPVLGVVSAPALGSRWWAATDSGAWKNGNRIFVSKTTRIEDAYLSLAGHREWHNDWDWQQLAELLCRCCYPAGSAGGFLPQMLVAEGILDIFIEPWGKVWDHSATAMIVQEAGGRASTLTGASPTGGSILATNGVFHSEVLHYLVRRASGS